MILGWTPGIGDPTPLGWLTVLAYALTALASAFAGQRGARADRTEEAQFWAICAVFLILLAINKQLDLQSLFTTLGRAHAQTHGWYQNRREVQAEFIYAILAAGVALGATVAWRFRKAAGAVWLAIAGLFFLGCFILIRAASFHHVDAFLKSGPLSIRWNWLLELGGTGIVAFAALRYRPQPAAPLPD